MALQVWLPLNGNLDNYGVAGDFTVPGTPTFVGGKVGGKALSLDHFYGSVTVPELTGVTNFSIAFWAKVDSSVTDYTAYADAFKVQATTGGTTNVIRQEIRNTADPGKMIFYLIKDATVGDNANTYANITGGWMDACSDQWGHFCAVKTDTEARLYVNGVLFNTVQASTFENTPQTLTGVVGIGESASAINPTFLQDFRIYDHPLSPKEIKILSQGLALHYPLNGGVDNMVKDSMAEYGQSRTTYNIGDFNLSESLVEGNTYTVRAKVNTSEEKKSVGFYFSGGTIPISGWLPISADGIYTQTFTATADMASGTLGDGHGYVRIYVSNREGKSQSGTALSGTANVDWVKLEKGSTATPWKPNPVDTLYTQMGFADNVIYDTSGFCRNGENHGATVAQGGKYATHYETNGTSTYILCDTAQEIKSIRDEITVSIWAYRDDWSTIDLANSRMFVSSQQSGGVVLGLASGSKQARFQIGVGDTSFLAYKSANSTEYTADTLSSGWHMFTLTYDGFTVKSYVDGNFTAQNKAYTTHTPIWHHATTIMVLGGESAGSSVDFNQAFTGGLSDLRIYATALSAEDIADLYKVSASVTNNGTLIASEISEV